MPAPRLLPLMFHADAVRALVVGGGAVATRRATTLLGIGASVTVVAPEVAAELPEGCDIRRRPFAEDDVVGHTLAIAATDVASVNAAVLAACRERGVPCCRADDASLGDFVFPAVGEAGEVVVAVSAGSPAMSRRALSAAVDAVAPLAAHAAAVALLRERIKASTPDATLRRAALADASSDEAAEVVREDGVDGLGLWLARRHPWLASDLLEAW